MNEGRLAPEDLPDFLYRFDEGYEGSSETDEGAAQGFVPNFMEMGSIGINDPTSSRYTGYSDFEGYRLYKSDDGGLTWGGPEDRIYENGVQVGWRPEQIFDFTNFLCYN